MTKRFEGAISVYNRVAALRRILGGNAPVRNKIGMLLLWAAYRALKARAIEVYYDQPAVAQADASGRKYN